MERTQIWVLTQILNENAQMRAENDRLRQELAEATGDSATGASATMEDRNPRNQLRRQMVAALAGGAGLEVSRAVSEYVDAVLTAEQILRRLAQIEE